MIGDRQRIQCYLKKFDFKSLFTSELGWDNVRESSLYISVNGQVYPCMPLVEKCHVKVYTCEITLQDGDGDNALLRAIERELTRYVHEHILIFFDTTHKHQVWLWVKREHGKPLSCYFNHLTKEQSGEQLAQKLTNLLMRIEEEEDLNMLIVDGRVRATFTVERVTKKFYARFREEHTAFLAFIEGIVELADREWYASLMLNRLMFVYFIQKKGFLDTQEIGPLNGDRDYLSERLKRVQGGRGEGHFHTFYRSFLLKLFHEGLGSQQRSPELAELLGNVPYLNGGLFDIHELEHEYRAIHIPDEAFEQLFRFFDEYDWCLDDRPLRSDKEINPDVIGYIFEKYINQKQMGAYYTQEDITEYISKNSIIPRIFVCLARKCPALFRPTGPIWDLVRVDPDRYIYAAIKHGCALPLPPEIEVGVDDIARRAAWDGLAPQEYALPKETWREVVARRQHYRQIKMGLAGGSVLSIDEFITYNLDLRQFAQDIIVYTEEIDLLVAFYMSLEGLTILDPTCGSGAFLFAALTILEPLYEACLERMQLIVNEYASSCNEHNQRALHALREIVLRVSWHANQRYFIYKSIIMKNLYGVDIMREATEICKLRLFLKPVSQIETFAEIKPLPDIDFNIRAGNALVGFATQSEVRKLVENDLGGWLLAREMQQQILLQGEESERHYAKFQQLQMEREMQPELLAASKKSLRGLFVQLHDSLDRYLATKYGIDSHDIPDDKEREERFTRWREAFRPFHWIAEYYGIMRNGGFDVIIGNPPYVAYSKVKGTYQIQAYETQTCGNLCAYVVERAATLLCRDGRCGMLMPVSTISGEGYRPLIQLLLKKPLWISSYSNRPGKLFADVEQRLAIILWCNGQERALLTSAYRHWYGPERAQLFATLNYAAASAWRQTGMPLKLGSACAEAIFARLEQRRGFPLLNNQQAGAAVWVHNGPTYWVRALSFEPNREQKSQRSEHYLKLSVNSQETAFALAAILSSSTFYFFYKQVSNCRDLGQKELRLFPVGTLQPEMEARLVYLGSLLAQRLKDTAERRARHYSNREGSYEVSYEEYYPARARELLDEIDRVLASHYGFSEAELDFLLHYDLKYRLTANALE